MALEDNNPNKMVKESDPDPELTANNESSLLTEPAPTIETMMVELRSIVAQAHGLLKAHTYRPLPIVAGRFYAKYAEAQRLLMALGPEAPTYESNSVELFKLMSKLEGYIEALDAVTNSQSGNVAIAGTSSDQSNEAPIVRSANTTGTETVSSCYKLKGLDPPTYSGDLKGWKAFLEAFNTGIDSQPLNAGTKMSYLKQSLKGKAAKAIEGLDITGENYETAWTILKERFGDKQKLITVYYSELDDLTPNRYASGQRSNLDVIKKIINNLKTLGTNVDQDCLKGKILRKFSKETVIAVLTSLDTKKDKSYTVEDLMSAISSTIRIQERAETYLREEEDDGRDKPRKRLPLAGALVGGRAPREREYRNHDTCIFCNSTNHLSKDCLRYRTLMQRRDCLERKRRCIQCLAKGHRGSSCRKRNQICKECDKKGHGVHMCVEHLIKITGPAVSNSTRKRSKSRSRSRSPTKSKKEYAKKGNFLETFLCRVETVDGFRFVRGVLDSCSEYSYIDKGLASSLGLKVEKPTRLNLCLFGTPDPYSVRSGEVRVTLTHHSSNIEKTFDLMITPCVTGPMDTSPPAHLAKSALPSHLVYADPDIFDNNKRPIQILIGNSYQFDVFSGDINRLPCNVVLRKSIFGWIPTGELRSFDTVKPCSSLKPSLLCVTPVEKPVLDSNLVELDGVLCNLWSLEAIGIKSSEADITDDLVLETFRRTVRFENERYVVRWPWKQENPQLPSNFRMAMARLSSLFERSSSDLMTRYQQLLNDQLVAGIIEPAPRTTPFLTHYLPHRALLQKNKIRVVYDASAKTKTGRSLNDLLHRGPVLLEGLVGLIINFRFHPVALTADIEKAFLQVSLNEVDRDCVRFLWLKDITSPPSKENLIVYRFARVPFGVISSPFLLNIVLQEHLSSDPKNTWNLLAKNKFYVDNLVVSVSDTSSALDLYSSVTSSLAKASFNLRDWTSNDTSFLRAANLTPIDQSSAPVSILGLNWNRQDDTLTVKLQSLGLTANITCITKRIALKYYASIFDPLGFFSPCTLELKLFIQECWKNEYNWDSPLPPDFVARWLKLYQESLEISNCPIPRRYWDLPMEGSEVSLHVFCDASKKAYACCAYLTYNNEKTCNSASALVYAKVRAAPVKKGKDGELSIPRLELLATLIGKRTSTFLKSVLDISVNRTVLWTDATTVLQWLNSSAVLPKFVENRISEIRRTPNLIIRYVPTNQNPADVASRGCTPLILKEDSLWWKGPSWLTHNSLWPPTPNTTEIYSTPVVAMVAGASKNQSLLSDELENRFSYWNSYVRIFKNINAYLGNRIPSWNARTSLFDGTDAIYVSNTDKFQHAERMLILEIQKKYFGNELKLLKKKMQPNYQLELYLDENTGFIRCKGRLQNADLPWDTIHPILLPKESPLTTIYIRKLHTENHHIGCSQVLAELRKRFWVVKARSMVNLLIRKCGICRRWEGGSYQLPPLPPLPLVRVREAAPFLHTGLDYLGNLTILDDNGTSITVYVALFTCLVTRAVHLELARNLSGDEFLMCMTRFTSRRRCPKFIISDNATNFTFVQPLVGKRIVEFSDYKVDKYLSTNNINWKFIPAYAPWHGGAYERLVALVKRSLKRTHGTQCLDYVQLNTALVQIEDTINSRPLTYVSSNEILKPLTPNHFLKPADEDTNVNTPLEITAKPLNSTTENLISAWDKTKGVVEAFWSAFRDHYLLSLRERHCAIHHPQHKSLPFVPKKGDIVLIKDPSAPRVDWKFGVIERVDRRQALAHVYSNKKILLRSVNQLFPLELPTESTTTPPSSNPKRPRKN